MTKKPIKYLIKSIIVFSAFYLLHGCYPKGPEYYSDRDLTATNYDPKYDFGNQKYFWIADTVRYITNVEDDDIDPDDESALIQKVESKLEELNYRRVEVTNPDSAEFVITINVISTRNSGVGWVPGPPCYPGWGWGCWPGYYPPYWGGYYTYSFSTGSVIINWYDPQENPVVQNSEENQPIHWTAAFNGLISSSQQNNAARIEASIDQAFKQSEEYLGSKR